MSSEDSQSLWATAFRLSDPDEYDSVDPDLRSSSLEAALSSSGAASSSSSSSSSWWLMENETTKQVTLRAVTDPWSVTRKKMIKMVVAAIGAKLSEEEEASSSSSSSRQVESWLLESAQKVFIVEAPWFALDGFLLLLKSLFQSQSQNQNNNQQSAQAKVFTVSSSTATMQRLLRAVLPHCMHQQEPVRDGAADFVVVALKIILQSENDAAGAADVIRLEQIEQVVVSTAAADAEEEASNSNSSSNSFSWWDEAQHRDHHVALGKLALASRGIAIDKLFLTSSSSSASQQNQQQQEAGDGAASSSSSSSCRLSPILKTWASSSFASIRFACGALFAQKDVFRSQVNNNKDNTNNNDDKISSAQIESRLFVVLSEWLTADDDNSSSWMLRETAAIAAGNLLREELPHCFQKKNKDEHQNNNNNNNNKLFFTLENASSFLVAIQKMGDANFEPVFDVRRACAQLLPFLSAYLVASAPSAEMICSLMERVQRKQQETERETSSSSSSSSASVCCDGTPQIPNTASCCALQNLFWFFIIRCAFEPESFLDSDPFSSDSGGGDDRGASATVTVVSPATSTSRIRNRIDAIISSSSSSCCSRVKLLATIYGPGLGLTSSNSSSSSCSSQLTCSIACDVRWVADWLRLAPHRALQPPRGGADLLRFIVAQHTDAYAQDLLLTALHDAGHIFCHSHRHQFDSVNFHYYGRRRRSSGGIGGAGGENNNASNSSSSRRRRLSRSGEENADGNENQTASHVDPNNNNNSDININPTAPAWSMGLFNTPSANVFEDLNMSLRDYLASAENENDHQNENNENENISTHQHAGDGAASNSENNNEQHQQRQQQRPTLLILQPFLFAMDSARFAPSALQQDGSDALADGSAWIHAKMNCCGNVNQNKNEDGKTATSASSSSSNTHHHARQSTAFENVSRWTSNCLVDRDRNRNQENEQQHLLDAHIHQLASATASILDILLVTGRASSTTELSTLLRAADATRSVMRAVGIAVTNQNEQSRRASQQNTDEAITTAATAAAAAAPEIETRITPQIAQQLFVSLSTPWLKRLDAARAAAQQAATATASVKKASDDNWDDTSSSSSSSSFDVDDQASGGAAAAGGGAISSQQNTNNNYNNNVQSSVTWEQEVETAKEALRHVVHIISEARQHQQAEEQEQQQQIVIFDFVKNSVDELQTAYNESCTLVGF